MSDRSARHRSGDFFHPRGLLDACLLLLMRDQPAHGYELRSRLARFGFGGQAPGSIYRALHRLQQDGLARATRKPSDCTGPERLVYTITADGEEVLETTRAAATEMVRILDTFLAQCESTQPRVSANGHHVSV